MTAGLDTSFVSKTITKAALLHDTILLQLQGVDRLHDDFEDERKKKLLDLEQKYNTLLGQVSTHAQLQGIN